MVSMSLVLLGLAADCVQDGRLEPKLLNDVRKLCSRYESSTLQAGQSFMTSGNCMVTSMSPVLIVQAVDV